MFAQRPGQYELLEVSARKVGASVRDAPGPYVKINHGLCGLCPYKTVIQETPLFRRPAVAQDPVFIKWEVRHAANVIPVRRHIGNTPVNEAFHTGNPNHFAGIHGQGHAV